MLMLFGNVYIKTQHFTLVIMLSLLHENERNRSVTLAEASELCKHQFQMSKASAIYYPYNYDIKDSGWGCAWRAIQMLLTYKDIFISFQNLYDTFSKRTCLELILKQERGLDEKVLTQLNACKWVPEQLNNHWAEPFICSLICSSYKISNTLWLLNGYPQANAPRTVFQRIVSFKQFTQAVEKNIHHSSIMIDDGYYALSIIGLRKIQQNVQFLFADPHIRSNKESKDVGLYRIEFDQNGRPVGDKLSEQQKVQALFNVHAALQFETKFWMICFINA